MPSIIVPNNTAQFTTAFDNVDDLRNSTAAAVGTGAVLLRGYADANDGGGMIVCQDPDDNSSLDDGLNVFVMIDGKRMKRIGGGLISLDKFGAVNDSVTAYDSLIEDAAAACAELKATLYLPPLTNGYPVTTEIYIPAGCGLICDAPIVDGSLTLHKGLKIGDEQATNNYVIYDLWMVRTTNMDWNETTDGIGIHIINLSNSRVSIRRAYGYNVNLKLTGAGTPGCAYNKFWIQLLHQARHQIELEAKLRSGDAVNGWVNENAFYGGRLTNNSAFVSGSIPGGVTPAGIVFKSGNVSPYNNNRFYNTCFELIPSASTRANLWKISGYAINNSISDARDEGNGTGAVVMEVDNSGYLSGFNTLSLGYSDDTTTDGTARITDASTGSGSALSSNQVIPPNRTSAVTNVLQTWSPSRMIESATAYHTDGRLSIPGLFWRHISGSKTQGSAATTLTVGTDYINFPASTNEGVAVKIDTTRMKKFAINFNPVASYNFGRTAIVCYDSSGTQITDGLITTCRSPGASYTPGVFGGSWLYGSSALVDTVVDVGSSVASVEVYITQYGAGGDLRLRPFSIVNLSDGPLICRSAYADDDGVTRFAIAQPADTTAKGNYQTGTFVKNISFTDSTGVLGWRNIGGNGGTWHVVNNDIPAAGAISYWDATGTNITIATMSDGTNNFVKSAPTTALASGSTLFDNGGGNNGRLRYTGVRTQLFEVSCSATVSAANGDGVIAALAKGGTVDQATRVSAKMGASGEDQVVSMRGIFSLATNEYVEAFFGNLTDTSTITVKALNITATSI